MSLVSLPIRFCRFSLRPAEKIYKNILKRSVKTHGKMSTAPVWVVEKEKLLNMDLEVKRKLYNMKKYVTINDISVWKNDFHDNFSSTKPPTESDKEELRDFNFDSSLNRVLAGKVSVWSGDITTLEIDAIVNAANSSLLGGGGVDGAIHRSAGHDLKRECQTLNGCHTGEAKITGGYLLPAKYVIHTVGPQDKSHEKLLSCYKSCFKLMRDNNLKTIAFPCISTGVYGFPNRPAAHIACAAARRHLEDDIKLYDGSIERVIFCTFLKEDLQIYQSLSQLYFPAE